MTAGTIFQDSAQAPDFVVPGHVVGYGAEEWRQCARAAADPGSGTVQDGMDMAPQAAVRDGAAGTRAAVQTGRGRQSLRGRQRAGSARTIAREEGLGGDRCGGVRGRNRADSAEARAGRIGGELGSLHDRDGRARQPDPNGRLAELFQAARSWLQARNLGDRRGSEPDRPGLPAGSPR